MKPTLESWSVTVGAEAAEFDTIEAALSWGLERAKAEVELIRLVRKSEFHYWLGRTDPSPS